MKLAHLGTFDVANYGDLLFPLILEHRLAGMCQEFVHVSPRGGSPVWDDCVQTVSVETFLSHTGGTDAVILGGGHILHASPTMLGHYDYDGISAVIAYPSLWLGAAYVSARENIPFCWNAPGVPGAFSPLAARLVRWAASTADQLSVRDFASRRLLIEAGITLPIAVVPDTALEVPKLWSQHDLATAYAEAFTQRNRNVPERTLAIHVNKRYGAEDIPALASLLDRVCLSCGATPILMALGPCHGDDELQGELARAMTTSPLLIDRPKSLREIAACIAYSEAYLGSSLHGMITACAFGKRGLVVGSHRIPKFKGFLDQFHLSSNLVESWEEAEKHLESLFNSPAALWERILPAATPLLDEHWKRLLSALKGVSVDKRSALLELEKIGKAAFGGEGIFQAVVAESVAHLLNELKGQRHKLQEVARVRLLEKARAANLDTALHARDTEVQELTVRLHAQEARAANLESELHARDTEVQELAVRFHAQEARAANLDAALHARDTEVQELTARLHAQEARATNLDTALHARDTEIQELAAGLHAQEARAADLDSCLQQQKDNLRAIMNSVSWRLTDPLRAIGQKLPWLRRLCRPCAILLAWTLSFRLPSSLIRKRRTLREDRKFVLKSGAFDPYWYQTEYPDVRKARVDPLLHYLKAGASEGRDPNCWFQTKWYVGQNPDLGRSGMNPLVHWLRFGQEKRLSAGSVTPATSCYNTKTPYRHVPPEIHQRLVDEYGKNHLSASNSLIAGKKVVVFTAISGAYDSLKVPEHLDAAIDYVLFTDRPCQRVSVYDVRPVNFFHIDPTRAARFVKTHPHWLLSDYDVAIWIDSNIIIRGEIRPLITGFIQSGCALGAIPHPLRSSVYEEASACLELLKDNPEVINEQIKLYRESGATGYPLIESNLLMFDLRNLSLPNFLELWWREIDRFSKRDQLSFPFVRQITNLRWHPLTRRPHSVRNHPSFALLEHDGSLSVGQRLLTAPRAPLVDPFVGIPFSEVRSERINRQQHRRIDVVICVHNALDDVRLCLESVLSARNNSNQRIIIIDDGSDTPTRDYLKAVTAKDKGITLCRNAVALGYTRAANMGLAESSGELVILLNSDTIVTRDWTEKLADAVFSTPGAGIVGPMSNAASHQSIPEHRSTSDQTAVNTLPEGRSIEDMNQFCEDLAIAGIFPRVPLIHGFCFGITRAALDKLGRFDAEHFPSGYGEENDYCFRATDNGIGMVVATQTYIFHSKSKSYSRDARIPLMKAGAKTLRKLHGDYRVERAIRTMENNPFFARLRRASSVLYPEAGASRVVSSSSGSLKESGSQRAPTKLYDVLALVPLQKSGALLESSHIRIIRPLLHPSLSDKVGLSVSGGESFSVREPDVLLVQGDAVRSATQARELVDRCKSRRTKLILDVDDDLINVPEFHDSSSLQASEAIGIIASAADAIFVSTVTLRGIMSQFSGSVHHLPNALDETLWLPANLTDKKGNGDGCIRILYMGKRIHRDDFVEVEDAINRLRRRHGDKLIFTCIAGSCIGGSPRKEGPNGIPLEPVPKRARTYPDFVKWMANFRHYDIAVGPAGKAHEHMSYLKYLDYGICKLAPIMSDVAAYRQAVRHLETGLLVGNSRDAWLQSLQSVLDDKKLLRRLQVNAYRDVLENHTLAAQAVVRRKIWLTILDS